MEWKQIIAGVVIGAVLGIGAAFFAYQHRISKLEGTVAELTGTVKPPVPAASQPARHPSWPHSPDGKYEAVLVQSGNGEHYQVKEIGTGRVVMTTHAQFETPNDAKAGLFGQDSKEVAAAYHYTHAGNYTWIGIWDIETGNLVETKRQAGWTTDIYWVFADDKK